MKWISIRIECPAWQLYAWGLLWVIFSHCCAVHAPWPLLIVLWITAVAFTPSKPDQAPKPISFGDLTDNSPVPVPTTCSGLTGSDPDNVRNCNKTRTGEFTYSPVIGS